MQPTSPDVLQQLREQVILKGARLMSNYLSISSRQSATEPYSAVHARTAMIHAENSEVAALSATNEPIAVLEPSLGAPVRIDLPHIGVVLSISVERNGSVHGRCVEHAALSTMTKADIMRDPVVKQLFCDFNRPEDRPSNFSGVYMDAVRLAVLARCLGMCFSSPGEPDDKLTPAALPKWRLKRVTDYIDENIGVSVTLADLADVAGLSKMYFAAQFRAATGLRPHEYVLRRRIDRAKSLLVQTEYPLIDVAFSVGFQTQAHFTTVFKRIVGITPGQWRSLSTRIL